MSADADELADVVIGRCGTAAHGAGRGGIATSLAPDLAAVLLAHAAPHAGILAGSRATIRDSRLAHGALVGRPRWRAGSVRGPGPVVPIGKNSSGSSPMHLACWIHHVSAGSRLNLRFNHVHRSIRSASAGRDGRSGTNEASVVSERPFSQDHAAARSWPIAGPRLTDPRTRSRRSRRRSAPAPMRSSSTYGLTADGRAGGHARRRPSTGPPTAAARSGRCTSQRSAPCGSQANGRLDAMSPPCDETLALPVRPDRRRRRDQEHPRRTRLRRPEPAGWSRRRSRR